LIHNVGSQGETGPYGDIGLSGKNGRPGPPGLEGEKGSKGSPGNFGPDGVPGFMGEKVKNRNTSFFDLCPPLIIFPGKKVGAICISFLYLCYEKNALAFLLYDCYHEALTYPSPLACKGLLRLKNFQILFSHFYSILFLINILAILVNVKIQ
jgi:hypothetical protein